MNIDKEMAADDAAAATPTAQQAEILNELISGHVIRSERINTATKYHHVIAKPAERVTINVHRNGYGEASVELDGNEVSQATLERMVANKWISGKIAGAGLAPPIEYRITDAGRVVVGQYYTKSDTKKGRR